MTLSTLIYYFLLSILLLICINYLKRKYLLNDMNTIIFTIILLILLAGFYPNNKNIFIVVVFEFIIDMIYTTYFLTEDFFKEDKKNITFYFVLIIISYIVNTYFINRMDYIFPKNSELRIVIWTIIILFLYNFFKDKTNLSEEKVKRKVLDNEEYIVINYAKFKSRYKEEIDLENKNLTNLIYSIMIYENYNRPLILRKIDTTKFKFTNKKTKQGIMQVNSKKLIDDIDSIHLVCKKIDRIYKRKLTSSKKNDIMKEIIKEYYKNAEKEENILNIYEVICEFSKE